MLEALLVTAGALMAAVYLSSRFTARRIRRNRSGRSAENIVLFPQEY